MNAFEEKFKNEEFLLYLLPSVARKMSRTCDAVYAEFGLTITEWRLLAQTSRFGSISAKEISERISLDQVSISRAAHSCVKRGSAEGIPDADDRRSKRLALSKDRESFMDRFLPRACFARRSNGKRTVRRRGRDAENPSEETRRAPQDDAEGRGGGCRCLTFRADLFSRLGVTRI